MTIANTTITLRSFDPPQNDNFDHEHETAKCANICNNKIPGVSMDFHKTLKVLLHELVF
jgi:hypothetical protein